MTRQEKKFLSILLAKPRGFCAGVERAINIVEVCLKKYGAPVYIKHQIVHNRRVVADLEKKGAVFIEDISKIQDLDRPLIFSAHGVSKEIVNISKKFKNINVIDATCPLVSKVHNECQKLYKKNIHIILIGHKGHPEVDGTLGQVPKSAITLIQNIKEATAFKAVKSQKYGLVTQTTLSIFETKEIIENLKKNIKDLMLQSKEDICYATTNRQLAVDDLAKKIKFLIVIGSTNSSNSKRLVDVAKQNFIKACLIDNCDDVPIQEINEYDEIGLTSGASAPEYLLDEILDKIRQTRDVVVTEQYGMTELTKFKLPKILFS